MSATAQPRSSLHSGASSDRAYPTSNPVSGTLTANPSRPGGLGLLRRGGSLLCVSTRVCEPSNTRMPHSQRLCARQAPDRALAAIYNCTSAAYATPRAAAPGPASTPATALLPSTPPGGRRTNPRPPSPEPLIRGPRCQSRGPRRQSSCMRHSRGSPLKPTVLPIGAPHGAVP